MIKKVAFLLIIGLHTIITSANAQSYMIKSLEGKNSKVVLFYKEASGILTINYLKDTLLINNYMAVDTVKILDKVFLQIVYAKRSGSNEDIVNELWLYVIHDKLGQALHINALSNYDRRPYLYDLFKLHLSLVGNTLDNYKINLSIHNEKRSQQNSKSNFKFDKSGVLKFDKTNNVFYSNYEQVEGNYTIHNFNQKNNPKKYIKDKLPVIIIAKNKYYYINQNWYYKDKMDFYSMLL